MRRREHCDADRPAISANCWLVRRPSSCSALNSLRSNESTESMREIPQMCTNRAPYSRNVRRLHTHCASGEGICMGPNSRRSAMGPFPHDAPAATVSADNPMGTDGFEFVEYAHPKPEQLHALFKLMGYAPVARHKTKKITVYRHGDINYLVNEQPDTHGFGFVTAH